MPITEVCSPGTRKGSKVGSNQPMSPGARKLAKVRYAPMATKFRSAAK